MEEMIEIGNLYQKQKKQETLEIVQFQRKSSRVIKIDIGHFVILLQMIGRGLNIAKLKVLFFPSFFYFLQVDPRNWGGIPFRKERFRNLPSEEWTNRRGEQACHRTRRGVSHSSNSQPTTEYPRIATQIHQYPHKSQISLGRQPLNPKSIC